MSATTYLSTLAHLVRDLGVVWGPFLLTLGLTYAVAFYGTKMVRTARRNAAIRAERATRAAYLAPVIAFPVRHTDHVA